MTSPATRPMMPPRLAESLHKLAAAALNLLAFAFRVAWFIWSGCFHKPFWSWQNWDRFLLLFPWLAVSLVILLTGPGAGSLVEGGSQPADVGYGEAFIETIRISPELAVAFAGWSRDVLSIAWLWTSVHLGNLVNHVLYALG